MELSLLKNWKSLKKYRKWDSPTENVFPVEQKFISGKQELTSGKDWILILWAKDSSAFERYYFTQEKQAPKNLDKDQLV